jgi:hypothetical protein
MVEKQYIVQLEEAQCSAVESILAEGITFDSVVHTVENTEWFAKHMRDETVDPATPAISCNIMQYHAKQNVTVVVINQYQFQLLKHFAYVLF